MRIGIDLGGTNIAGGLIDESGKLLYKHSVRTDTSRGANGICSDIVALIEKIRQENGNCEILSIGVGVPGQVDCDTQLVVYCNNIPLQNTDLKSIIEEKTGIPAFIGNDADAAALGEVKAGAAQSFKDVVMITLGTGIGCGLIFGGRAFPGCNGASGEIGHISLIPDGIECNCGRRGCFELYASATALKRQTREAMEKNPESKLWEIAKSLDNVSGKTAFDAMRAGDAAGSEVVRQYIEYLAIGLTDIVNLLQPEAIIIGGGISKEGETLLAPVRDFIARNRYSRGDIQTQVLKAALGNDAGIIGAAFFGV